MNLLNEFPLTGFIIVVSFLLPLFSFFISFLIGERYGWSVALIAPLIMMVSAILSGIALWQNGTEGEKILAVPWFSIAGASFNANLMMSHTSLMMFFIVALISFLVHLYSVGYMAGDMAGKRYFAMLGFFTFSMQGIVLADSLLLVFVFWELVGFSSYLLIGHYMEKAVSAHASKKAFLMNRFGDAAFVVGLMVVWTNAGTLDISQLIKTSDHAGWQTVASLCIFGGIIGKSAQFPLFTWLPDAMEGPTPVSALIHAATMVAAGVYLLARLFPLFTAVSLATVTLIGSITSLLGAVCAVSQNDIKRILAYSTISQLGLMFVGIGMGAVEASLLHLFTHAFFKGCLFLCAGSVILALHQAQLQSRRHFDAQDIRNLGGLSKKIPVTTITFLISAASLAGIPFFSGFLSKEAILTGVWESDSFLSQFAFVVILMVSFLTILYTFRITWFTFFGQSRTDDLTVRESPLVMQIPMIILAFCSLWFVVSWNPVEYHGWVVSGTSPAPAGITIASLAVIAVALIAAWLFFRGGSPRASEVLENSFFIDRFYRSAYARTILPAAQSAGYVDKKVIDRFLHVNAFTQVTIAHVIQWFDANVVDGVVSAITRVVAFGGFLFRSIQGGKIQLYIFWALFAIIIFLIYTLN
jgi:NADH-quinone oxidoreductase subunit L